LPFEGSSFDTSGPVFSVTNSADYAGQGAIPGTGSSSLNSGSSGYGVEGVGGAGGNSSTAGTGVIGQGGSSFNGNGGDGVVGLGANVTQNGDGGNGIVGTAGTGSTNGLVGYAGLFHGNVSVLGTLSKSAGSFRIDDPLDPANKFLSHSFVESPDMMNIYNGIAVLDDNGEAWVTMPPWFEALNRDFRYQLTSVGRPGPNLYIGSEISENRFRISGGSAGQKVSWQVTGIRHDEYAEANRIPVEEMKPAQDRGYYLHPELFGQPVERSIFWAHRPEMLRKMLAPATEVPSASFEQKPANGTEQPKHAGQ
jgi:hypothetical protein